MLLNLPLQGLLRHLQLQYKLGQTFFITCIVNLFFIISGCGSLYGYIFLWMFPSHMLLHVVPLAGFNSTSFHLSGYIEFSHSSSLSAIQGGHKQGVVRILSFKGCGLFQTLYILRVPVTAVSKSQSSCLLMSLGRKNWNTTL